MAEIVQELREHAEDLFHRAADEIERLRSDVSSLATTNTELATEIERLRKETRWQPIETAPKDGTIILVPGGIAYWPPLFNEWRSITAEPYPGRPIEWDVRYWRPLPAPPEAEG